MDSGPIQQASIHPYQHTPASRTSQLPPFTPRDPLDDPFLINPSMAHTNTRQASEQNIPPYPLPDTMNLGFGSVNQAGYPGQYSAAVLNPGPMDTPFQVPVGRPSFSDPASRDPSLGPRSSFSDPASRDPSVGPRGTTPMEDYQQLYARGQNRQTPYQSYFSQRSALGGSGGHDSMDSPLGLHTTVRQNAVEIHRLIERVNTQEESIQEVKKMNELLTSRNTRKCDFLLLGNKRLLAVDGLDMFNTSGVSLPSQIPTRTRCYYHRKRSEDVCCR
ncbi:hypothetical protein J3R83DRAFT_7468 [Lanmaoa asiatica]|nr:hypothetical protein J3R83DRAFT_7468 [Lanmaoa asiatica]